MMSKLDCDPQQIFRPIFRPGCMSTAYAHKAEPEIATAYMILRQLFDDITKRMDDMIRTHTREIREKDRLITQLQDECRHHAAAQEAMDLLLDEANDAADRLEFRCVANH